MGWCSGTEIFDVVCKELLKDEIDKKKLLHDLVLEMHNHDWDCESDSDYFDHPLVQEVMREILPSYFFDYN